ncbi:MAG: DUF2608 domain-containing protein [Gammaproteobacteria bacterium]|nr:DUF2608 domain-containing protein [Gammaproteobacteria bacterium]
MREPSGNQSGVNFFQLHTDHPISESTDFSASVRLIQGSDKKSVAIFDIDNTLLLTVGYKPALPVPRQSGYASDIWFTEIAKQLDSASPDYPKLFMMLVAEYSRAQHYVKHTTTEDCIIEELLSLKAAGIPILGITARSSRLAEITTRRLDELGIQFSGYNHQSADLDIEKKAGIDNAVYHAGKIYCSGRSKKTCLNAFLKTDVGCEFFSGVTQALFIDDSLKHCEDMRQCLLELKVTPIVVHYTHVEKKLAVATQKEMQDEAEQLKKDIAALC